MGSRLALIWVFLVCVTPAARAVQPPRFNYQAKLMDSGGLPISGTHDVFFSLYNGGDAATPGSGALAFEESKNLSVSNGIVNHVVGTGTPTTGTLTIDLFRFNGDIFLEVAVDSPGNVILPRTRLESVPFAINSADGDARIPIGGPAPVTISQPGSYYLTQNITGVSGQNGVTISTDNVTLDLNGYTLSAITGLALNGISVSGSRQNIVIRNGIIKNWPGGGLDASSAQNVLAEDLVAATNTGFQINVGQESSVLRCQALGDAPLLGLNSRGIVAGTGCTVAYCTANSNSQNGIEVEHGCSVVNCTVSQNTSNGIVARNSNTISGCTCYQNGQTGIFVDTGGGNRITGNTCTGNDLIVSVDIRVGGTVPLSDNTVEGNTCTGGAKGLFIESANCVITNNVVRGNVDNYDIADGNILNILLCEIPETIDWPGNVTLAGSLTGLTDSAGITVNADNVTIDLAGHTLSGAFRSLSGVLLTGTRKNVEISNGVLVGWSRSGVEATTSTDGMCENLRVSNSGLHGIDTGSGWAIDHCITQQNGVASGANNGNGIKASVSSITNCVSRNNDGNGIFAGSNCTVTGCIVSNNTGAGNNGMQIGAGGIATNCVANNNGENGIFGATVTIQNCEVRDNAKDGILVLSNSQVIGNQCIDNGLAAHNASGIHASSTNNRIERNQVTGNHFGLDIDTSPNFIAGNTVGASESNANYTQVSAGNFTGPILNSSAGVTGNTNPMANIEFP